MKDILQYKRLENKEYIGDDKYISIEEHTTKNFPPHFHDYLEIEIITDGSALYTLNGEDFEISKGSVLFVTTTDFHNIVSDKKITLLNISFKESMLGEKNLLRILKSDFKKNYYLEGEKYNAAINLVKLLQYETEQNGKYQKVLLEYLFSLITDIPPDKHSANKASAHSKGIRNALIFLELHFREPITLTQLAKQAGFTNTYFSELFKKITGETYLTKLTNLRLEYACLLLSNGYSVTRACFESGFSSLSNFHLAFKNKYSISPGKYKNHHY